MVDLEFIIDECKRNLDTDPQHWNSDEGCVRFDEVPVFYFKSENHIVLEIEGMEFRIERF